MTMFINRYISIFTNKYISVKKHYAHVYVCVYIRIRVTDVLLLQFFAFFLGLAMLLIAGNIRIEELDDRRVCMYVCMYICAYVLDLAMLLIAGNIRIEELDDRRVCVYVCMYVCMYVCAYVFGAWICGNKCAKRVHAYIDVCIENNNICQCVTKLFGMRMYVCMYVCM
jgi:hypothetical protein